MENLLQFVDTSSSLKLRYAAIYLENLSSRCKFL